MSTRLEHAWTKWRLVMMFFVQGFTRLQMRRICSRLEPLMMFPWLLLPQSLKPSRFLLAALATNSEPRRQRSAPPPRSSVAWAAKTIGAPVRSDSADARLQAHREVVHLSGFSEPRSHTEFKLWTFRMIPRFEPEASSTGACHYISVHQKLEISPVPSAQIPHWICVLVEPNFTSSVILRKTGGARKSMHGTNQPMELLMRALLQVEGGLCCQSRWCTASL
eukprot:4129231-Amphidinium_carterae.1